MNTFIRAAEVWLPSADRSLLEFGGGAYAAVPYFGAVSRSLCFGRGEGLPGRAWGEGRPIVLQRFDDTYFLRIVAAHEAGLACAVAVPTFKNGELSAVLVLFCGDRNQPAGAVELWRNDARVASDRNLVDGYYGASAAAVAGLDRTLAVPCGSLDGASYVLTLRSSSALPVAMRIESWVPAADGVSVLRDHGHCEVVGALPPQMLPLHHAGAVGVAFAEQRPVIRTTLSNEPATLARSAGDAQLSALVALPVPCNGGVGEVMVLYS
ncbi:GAF domain-containing protein [Aquabacterium sp.]|uniref:GAF domain-containing protein n=1 Tax=Aquabacterium sp. TaxID=1872578 RepID=UPI0035B1C515